MSELRTRDWSLGFRGQVRGGLYKNMRVFGCVALGWVMIL